MSPPHRDANDLTPTEARVATHIASAGIVDVEALVDAMGYRHSKPILTVLRVIRRKLQCAEFELAETLSRLGYDR